MLPDPEAAIGCIPDEMQKGPTVKKHFNIINARLIVKF